MAKKLELINSGKSSNTSFMDDPMLKSLLGCGTTGNITQAGSQKVPLDFCYPWHDEDNATQPFRIYPQERLQELAADMAARGLDNPIIVRSYDGGFQILAGHNRVEAAKMIGWTEIDAKVVDVDDDAARLIMVNTNLMQREKILPSEKARAYKIQLDAMKRQGKRTDLTCAQIEHKLNLTKSRDIIADQMGENRNQIQRYIRLNELVPQLLDMVDNEQLPFTVGVSLSYLSHPKQQLLLDIMGWYDIQTINGKQAEFFKSRGDTLDDTTIRQIFGVTDTKDDSEPKPQKPIRINIPANVWPKHIPAKMAKDKKLIQRIAAVIEEYAAEQS